MYSLKDIDNNAHSIINYVKNCMKEKKLGATEIKEYERQARRYAFDNLIVVSQEYLDMLNQMDEVSECKVSYVDGLL